MRPPPATVRSSLLGALLGLLGVGGVAALHPVAAQDVELLGRRYGTPLPAAYDALRTTDPDAFRFRRGRALRARRLAPEPGESLRDGPAIFRTSLGPRGHPVRGEVAIPVLLGLFSDTPGEGEYRAETVIREYFADRPGTIRDYYDEVSGGRLDLRGEVGGWFRSEAERTRAWVTDGQSGLGGGGRLGSFIKDLVRAADAEGWDWGRFDDDGPDGIPNSGDDDGFVDAVAVLHPTRGGECGGDGSADRVWSHRWSLSSSTGRAETTTSPAAGGGFIQVDDYLIQPIRSCGDGRNATGLNEIGVFTHELGHAFGLPDLYDTNTQNGTHQGAGTWDLMATGSWGCDDRSPDRPCHMGAWSRVQLGWAEVVEVSAGRPLTSVTLPPVETGGPVYRVASADGSGEYFLLENRQPVGFDATLHRGGLLVWQIDPDQVALNWPFNSVNASLERGVWLRQADGLDQLGLAQAARGDAGDPFPYEGTDGANRDFHASTVPASRSSGGDATAVTLLDIRREGQQVSFDLVSRYNTVTVRTESADAPQRVFSVDGTTLPGRTVSFSSAPFQRHEVEAAPGRTLEPGVRRPFESWVDDPVQPRVRTVTTEFEDVAYTARYAGRQVEVAMEVQGGVDGIAPVDFVTVPQTEDLWFPEGTEVTLEARARRGFRFLGWTGALQGEPNPAVFTLEGPTRAGADFELVYEAVSSAPTLEATREHRVELEVRNGTLPVRWTILEGPLPGGLRLDADGVVEGVPLETGIFPVRLRARDGLGLTAEAELTLTVEEPVFGLDVLTAPFLLTGPELTDVQERFLDLRGNDSGAYDLGDFRAWLLAHPGLPATTPPGGSGTAAGGGS